jgi:uncharacterized damage-inducible protein DinB
MTTSLRSIRRAVSWAVAFSWGTSACVGQAGLEDHAGNLPRRASGAIRQEREGARDIIGRTTDEQFMQPWTLLSAGATVFTMPKAAVMRSFVMNHMIHHRAQLGVYLRLNDVPVPAIYGPSADEQGM